MFYGVDTRKGFVGRCIPLIKALDKAVLKEYGQDPPFALEYMFRLQLMRELIGADMRAEYICHISRMYVAIDDPVLKHAIDEDHLWILTLDARGYYLANCLPKGH